MPAGSPTGYVLPPASDTRAQQVMVYAADFAQQFGPQAGTAFTSFANSAKIRPYSAAQAADAFAGIIGTQGLAAAISAGATGLGAFLGAAVKASGPAAANTSAQIPSPGLTGINAIGDFFSKLGTSNLWTRAAEVVIGLGLIIVGLAKLASGTSVGKAALKAGKAVRIL